MSETVLLDLNEVSDKIVEMAKEKFNAKESCDYCKKIYNDYEELETIALKYGTTIRHGIIKDNDKYNLGIPSDDMHYSPIAYDIKYCPYCGREL